MTRVRSARRLCRRIVGSFNDREYVVELRPDMLVMRPLRSRRGSDAEIGIKWEALYVRVKAPGLRQRAR